MTSPMKYGRPQLAKLTYGPLSKMVISAGVHQGKA
jgi:hypothetical protein